MISSTGEAHIQVSLPVFYLEWTVCSMFHLETIVLSSRNFNRPHAVFWLHLDDQNLMANQYSPPPPDSFGISSFRATWSSRVITLFGAIFDIRYLFH